MNELIPKQQFLNQYRGQKVFYLDGLSKPKTAPIDVDMDGDYVELRLINQLTDEEARLIGLDSAKQINTMLIASGTLEKFIGRYIAPWQSQLLVQFGILMPFSFVANGVRIHLSPIQILERGWAKEKGK